MSIRTKVIAGAGALALAGLTAGAALAGVSGPPITTANGEAGYGTTVPAGKTISNVQAVVTPDQYGTTIQGGAIGFQLATTPAPSGSCFAAQLGLVANTSTSTYAVEYGAHAIGGPSEKCPAGGVLNVLPNTGVAHTLGSLSGLPNNASVWLSLTYVQAHKRICIWSPWGHRGHWGHHSLCFTFARTGLVLSAENLDAASPSVTSAWLNDPHVFTNASFGISLDNDTALVPAATGITEPGSAVTDTSAYTSYADQEVAEFDYATITEAHSVTPLLLDAASLTPSSAVAQNGGGKVIVAPNDTLSDSGVYPVSPALGTYAPASIRGASTIGNSFQLFTGNSIG